MQQVKEQIRKEVEMKIMGNYSKIKEKVLAKNKLKCDKDCPPEIIKAIENIKQKISLCKLAQLHPPFLPKTVTKYRHEFFLPVKRDYHKHLNSSNQEEFKKGQNILYEFVANFDCQMFDIYLEQIREPYIRKIFNENYQFDKLDFKNISQEYQIRAQIQNVLNSASEWLLQIERTQDLLERIQLYFDIRTPMVIEKAKKEGIESNHKRTFGDAFNSTIRNLASYTLRKSSKVIQTSFFTTLAPATAMLTLAIIGGSATLPWESDINGKLLIAPIVAITVPYLLDGLACSIERKQFLQKLEEWAIALQGVARSIAKFNEQLQETILACCTAQIIQDYEKQKINLQKYVHVLNANLASLTDFSQAKFQEMRDRSEAYFKKYIEIEQGQWKIVIPHEQYNSEGLLKK